MKKKFIATFFVALIFLNSCTIGYGNYFPTRFYNSKWSSNTNNSYFIVISHALIGELQFNAISIPIELDFRNGSSGQIHLIDLNHPNGGNYYRGKTIMGIHCKSEKDKFTFTVDYVYDNKYQSFYNKNFTFTREDLTEEEALKMRNEIIEKYGLNLESDSAGS